MNDRDYSRNWFRLSQVNGLGPKRLHAINHRMREEGLPIDLVFEMNLPQLHSLFPKFDFKLLERILLPESNDASALMGRLTAKGVQLIHLEHLSYPQVLLRRLGNDSPPIFYCVGNTMLLQERGVAIVGARNASTEGLNTASRLAANLANFGLNVISGYAKGVDTAAHSGALEADGTTTAVLSNGILEFAQSQKFDGTRSSNSFLAVSQFHPVERWLARNAMTRNTIVCGLAQAVVVIESGPERDERGRMSGTYAAGKAALEMGVPLFVLNSPPSQGATQGNFDLIEAGGHPIDPDAPIAELVEHFDSRVSQKPQDQQGSLF